MPIVVIMKFPGITPAQYDESRKIINWEGNVAKGALFHVASFDKEGLRATDVWESAEDFDNFVKNRLMPGLKKQGISAQPQVEIFPTHAIFAPGYKSKI
jgi:hypothetical protein